MSAELAPNLLTRVYRAIRPPPARPAARMIANSRRAVETGAPLEPRRFILPRREDFGQIFIADLDLNKLKSIFSGVIGGDASVVGPLYDKMLQRDAHIRAESRKRFAAVRGLVPEIIAASPLDEDDPDFDDARAKEIAGHCKQVFRRLAGRDAALNHLVEARGRGIMAVEVEWGDGVPVALHPIPFTSLHYDDREPWRLRIRNGDDWRGLAVDESYAGKFLVAAPESLGGNGFAGGLFFASLLWYCFKVWDQRFLMTALEIFGQPQRVAKYPAGSTPEVISEMLRMLREMGSTAAGVFPIGCEFEAITGGIGNTPAPWPQERVFKLFNEEISKLWIGGSGTTVLNQDGGGSQAAATVHETGFERLRDEDIAAETGWIGEQLLRPMVLYQFGEQGLPYVPTFRRCVEKQKDIEQAARVLSIVINELGANVPMSVVKDELGIPLIEADSADAGQPLPGQRPSFDPFGVGNPGGLAASAKSDRLHRRAGARPAVANRATQREQLNAVLQQWAAQAAAFAGRSGASIDRLVNGLRARLETLHEDADLAAVNVAIAGIVPELAEDDLALLFEALLTAGFLRGAEAAAGSV